MFSFIFTVYFIMQLYKVLIINIKFLIDKYYIQISIRSSEHFISLTKEDPTQLIIKILKNTISGRFIKSAQLTTITRFDISIKQVPPK